MPINTLILNMINNGMTLDRILATIPGSEQAIADIIGGIVSVSIDNDNERPV